MSDPVINCKNLSFDFGGPTILDNIHFQLPRGSRCLLVGANGAGKSTLLRILAGKNLVNADVQVLGKNPFRDGSVGITYLGTEWAHNPIVRRDVPVARLLKTLGAERYKERCEELLEIMDVNPNWHMHQVSDGQRRRVQIVLGLMEPWDVLLLDEVTVDLDVLVRADLLNFLVRETKSRGATILYATHIFDGLGTWPTHVAHMVAGRIDFVRSLVPKLDFPEIATVQHEQGDAMTQNSLLLTIVEKWLRDDYKLIQKEKQKDEPVPRSKWDVLSERMDEFGDKYYNYWR